MYNRYIPQNDGTYRRSRVVEPPAPPASKSVSTHETPREENCARQEEILPCQRGKPCNRIQQPKPIPHRPKTQPVSIGSFLKQLIPAGFDTEDLIIVLLLLLMAGDCQEDQNSALLTLVLYLFL